MGDSMFIVEKNRFKEMQQLGVVALQDACDLASFVVLYMIGERERKDKI